MNAKSLDPGRVRHIARSRYFVARRLVSRDAGVIRILQSDGVEVRTPMNPQLMSFVYMHMRFWAVAQPRSCRMPRRVRSVSRLSIQRWIQSKSS